MEVIATVKENLELKYIAKISHYELEKFLNKYYDKLDKLEAGEEIDLAKGYDFYHKTINALSKTEKFIEANKEVIETIMTGISLCGQKD